jgi:hypothetical protein
MPDLVQYFSAISDEKRKLDAVHYTGFVFMTSVRNLQKNSTAGCVCECTTKQAAKHLVDSTARESTPQEIESFKQQGILFAAKCAAAEARRNPALGQTLVIMPGQGTK